MKRETFSRIRRLVGTIKEDDLRYVETYVHKDVGVFMPAGGACQFAISPEHTHPSYMFTLNFDETTMLKMGQRIIRSVYGKLLALSPSVAHQEMPADRPPRYIAIMIDKGFFELTLKACDVKDIPLFLGDIYDVDANLLPALKRFMVEADNPLPGADMMLQALSVEVCHLIIRSIFRPELSTDRVSERIEINRVVEYMHTHLGEKLVAEQLAHVAHMSVSHFTRLFKAETSRTPMEYLITLRLERAKRLLIAGELTITGVALECGFGSPSYLSTSFQQRFGVSPKFYQKGAERIPKRKGRKPRA